MGRMYSVIFEAVATTTAVDLFELTPAANKPIVIHGIWLGQTTELADAAEEQLRISIIRGYTTGGSGGSAPTANPLSSSIDTAAGCTAEVNNTTVASNGSPITLHTTTWNLRSEFVYIPTPEMRIGCSAANTTIVVRLLAAPSDSVTMTGTLVFEELY